MAVSRAVSASKRRGFLVNLALLVTSTGLALLLGEVSLQLLGWRPLYVSPERDRFWRYDPLLGWAHEPGQEGIFEARQFRTHVRINQAGLRDREHTYDRPDGVKRILVVGDSFAWGYGVEDADRFSQRLESMPGVEVINAGVSGYSTDQELLWLTNEGVKYEFDLVILALTGNDLGDNHRDLVNTIYYKPRFVNDEGQLTLVGYPVPRTNLPGKLIYHLSQRSALTYFLVQRYFDLLALNASRQQPSPGTSQPGPGVNAAGQPFELTIALLDEIRGIAESGQAEFMIVATDRWWNGPTGTSFPEFIEALEAADFPVLDVEALPGFELEAMVIPGDGHWNSAGHAFVADALKTVIETKDLLGETR